MFLTYLRRELRRRMKQAIVVAAGLAIGIGLVLTVSASSRGVKNAQAEVLHALYGVGTDITVTKAPSPGAQGPLRFGGSSGSTSVSGETLHPSAGLATLPESDVSKVASLRGTAVATGGLLLNDTKFSGTIPTFPSGRGGAGAGATTSSLPSGSAPSFSVSSFSLDGVQISPSGVGPLAPSQVTKGRYFTSAEKTADVAILSTTYATQNGLKVGSNITVKDKAIAVIGLAQVPSGAADVYLPLGTAQSLSGLTDDVTTIFVSASSASAVAALASEIQKAIPGSTVTTSASLASEVTGSLASASKLATSLGTWLSIAALAVAFLIAGLLMMAAVSRRVREFGTLKAIGWRSRRIVEQVMGEGLALGLVGGVVGILLGIAGCELISAVSPALSATFGPSSATGGGAGFGGSGFGGGFRRTLAGSHTVLVHLTAPLQGGTVALAVVLAVAGGLVAGAFGSWRAARLSPAAALRRVE